MNRYTIDGIHIDSVDLKFSWDNLKQLEYIGDMATPFSLSMQNDEPTLFCDRIALDTVSFLPTTDFDRE